MRATLREKVRERAGDRCEYCHLRQADTTLPHEVDHIRARKHRGGSLLNNLSFSCAYCNGAKGPNIAGHDPETDELVRLFNPRTDRWSDHFAWKQFLMVGKTPIGRATIEVLRINGRERVQHRRFLAL